MNWVTERLVRGFERGFFFLENVRADRNTNSSYITSFCNRGEQKSNSACRTLKLKITSCSSSHGQEQESKARVMTGSFNLDRRGSLATRKVICKTVYSKKKLTLILKASWFK